MEGIPISKDIIEQMLYSAAQERDQRSASDMYQNPEFLTQTLKSLKVKQTIKTGDIVRWKPNLNDKRYPEENHPAIVVDVLSSPHIDSEQSSSSHYFKNKLDMEVGVFIRENEQQIFLTFLVNSQRMERFPKEELEEYKEMMEDEIAQEENSSEI